MRVIRTDAEVQAYCHNCNSEVEAVVFVNGSPACGECLRQALAALIRPTGGEGGRGDGG